MATMKEPKFCSKRLRLGGIGAVTRFMDRLIPQIHAEKARTSVGSERKVVAIVNLGVDSYPNKTYGGQTFYPVFEVLSWANMMGEQDEPGAVEAPFAAASARASTETGCRPEAAGGGRTGDCWASRCGPASSTSR